MATSSATVVGPTVLGSVQLCTKGCGFPIAAGENRHGRSFVTCCKACALGNGHDEHCPARLLSADAERLATASIDEHRDLEGAIDMRGVDVSGVLPLCRKGCGLEVAPGKDLHGRFYETCCRGCALGGAHDVLCQVSDPAQRQILKRELSRTSRRRWRRVRKRVIETLLHVWDPVWGQAAIEDVSNASDKEKAAPTVLKASAVACFLACPCFVVGCCCSPTIVKFSLKELSEKRVAWCKTLFSISTVSALAQVVMYVVTLLQDDYTAAMPQSVLERLGAKNCAKILYRDEWWRLASPMMLHGGIMHLLSNVLMQIRFGFFVEYLWGHAPFLLIYLLSGVYGNIASCVFLPDALSVGSSGALSGLYGAWIPSILFTWHQTEAKDIEMRNGQLLLAATSAMCMILVSFMPMVDYAAHVGGLAMGAALYVLFLAGRIKDRRAQMLARLGGFVCVTALLAAGIWLLLETKPHEVMLRYGSF